MTSSTKTSNTPPVAARFGTKLESILRLLGRHPLPRNPEVLIRRARESTGLSDFGLPQFMEAYRVLHRSLCTEARLHVTGERLMADLLHILLCNRLRIEETKRTNPEIAAERIERPVIILGLPRTGSTFLQRLIAADPAFHSIRYKEGLCPAPPPGITPHLEAMRQEQTEKICRARRTLVPRLDVMHEMTPDSPEECSTLLRNTFLHGSFHLVGPMPTYSHHFWNTDRALSYNDYHYQLKLLQFARPSRRWLLKGPAHWSQVHLLLKLFPDACFIQTHRHPRDVIASWVNMFDAMMELHSTHKTDPHERARTSATGYVKHLQTLHDFRTQNPASPFCDVRYKDLIQDPMTQVRRIYAAIGQPLSTESETTLLAFIARDRAARKNYTRESREQFGPTDAELNEMFATYLARQPGL